MSAIELRPINTYTYLYTFMTRTIAWILGTRRHAAQKNRTFIHYGIITSCTIQGNTGKFCEGAKQDISSHR